MDDATASADLGILLALVSKGDQPAFSNLYTRTNAKLFGTILRILRHRELAEEVLQEAYIKIWECASDFEPGRASAITWMVTIARNRALDVVRRRQLNIAEDASSVTEIADQKASPAERLEMSEELQRLEACLEGLDEQRRVIVKLAYLDGFSRQELAEHFGHPVGTIKTWLHRSLKQLQDCLES